VASGTWGFGPTPIRDFKSQNRRALLLRPQTIDRSPSSPVTLGVSGTRRSGTSRVQTVGLLWTTPLETAHDRPLSLSYLFGLIPVALVFQLFFPHIGLQTPFLSSFCNPGLQTLFLSSFFNRSSPRGYYENSPRIW